MIPLEQHHNNSWSFLINLDSFYTVQMVTPIHCLSDLSSVVQLRSDLSQNSPCWWLCNEWCGVFDHTGVLIKRLRLCGLLFLLNGIPVSGFHQSTERVRVRKREGSRRERERKREREIEREKKGERQINCFSHSKTLSHKKYGALPYKNCFEFPFQPTINVRYRFWIWLYVSGIPFHILPFIKLLTRPAFQMFVQNWDNSTQKSYVILCDTVWYYEILKVTLSHIKKNHEMPCPKLDQIWWLILQHLMLVQTVATF